MASKLHEIVDRELDKMLEEGVVERSSSDWPSPIVMVWKKDNTYRFCVDFRKLNVVTSRDAYPLYYISSILDKLQDGKFLTAIDISSAYWQITLAVYSFCCLEERAVSI